MAFESNKLKDVECNYPTHNLELLGVVRACRVWRHYLLGVKFKLRCDHQSLKYIMTQWLLNNRHRWWLEFLQEYDFEIEYLPVKNNVVVDALNRREFVAAITVVRSHLGERVIEALLSDPLFGEVYRLVSGVLT